VISVLCVAEKSNYYKVPGLDLWDAKRDAYYFTGSNPVIAHPPCAQWSRMKAFSKNNPGEKELAWHCLKYVLRNGGVFEHPYGSSFFRASGLERKIIYVDQWWWGFPARKRTALLFVGCKPLSYPLNFDLCTGRVDKMKYEYRSIQPVGFCQWLVNSVQVC
jgi:hypothetical protein